MSTLNTTNLKNESSVTNNIVLGADGSINLDAGTLYVDAVNNRVGINTTSPGTKLEVGGSAAFRTDADVRLTIGSTGSIGSNDSNYIRAATNQIIYNAASGRHSWEITGSEKARIDSSGRLLVGTSTPSAPSGSNRTKLEVSNANLPCAIDITRNDQTVGADEVIGQIRFFNNDDTGYQHCADIEAISDGSFANNDKPTRLVFSTTADGASGPTERMRIGSDGALYVGTTSQLGTAFDFKITAAFNNNSIGGIALKSTASGSSTMLEFINNSGAKQGSITCNSSATAYNTSSDYRLKENVVPLTGAADRLKLIPVHRFNFIADPDTTVDGFIAHEAQAVVPECVTGTKDEVDDDGNPVYQGIDQSKLVPLLTAALQEALAEIESLKARVTALEP